MKRVQILLTTEQYDALRTQAFKSHISMGRLVRYAVDTMLARHAAGDVRADTNRKRKAGAA